MNYIKSHRKKRRLNLEALERRMVLDSTVVFNELMYNPSSDASLEWIELHNEMAVDMDLSNWRIDGVGYSFPEETILEAGQYLLVAKSPADFSAATGIRQVLGPYDGNLSNAGETLRLVNNSQRVMDEVQFNDRAPWPVGADGSGASLAKILPDGGSNRPDNWAASQQIGGTPGADNFPSGGITFGESITLIGSDQVWYYDDSGTDYGVAWASPEFDPGDPNGDGDPADAWKSGRALLGHVSVGSPLSIATQIDSQATTQYFRTEFDYDGSTESNVLNLNAIVDDGAVVYLNGQEVQRINMPSGPITFETLADSYVDDAEFSGNLAIPSHALVAGRNVLAIEVHQAAPADPNGGPELPSTVARFSAEVGFSLVWDGTDGQHYDTSAPPDGAIVPRNRALASEGAVAFAGSDLGPEIGVDFHVTENLNDGFYGNSNSWIGGDNNPFPQQFAGIRFPAPINVSSIAWGRDNGNNQTDACEGQCTDRVTGTYSIQYTTSANPGPTTEDTGNAASGWQTVALVTYRRNQDEQPDGGFTNYLRHEYHLQHLGQPIEATGIRIVVPKTGLASGTAIDEIEVYEAESTEVPDAVFGASLTIAEILNDANQVAFSEVAGASDDEFFVELVNPGQTEIDLTGYTIFSSNANSTPLELMTSLPAGGYLALTGAPLASDVSEGDRLFLLGPGQATLVDAVRIDTHAQARGEEHGDRWLVPREVTPGDTNLITIESDIVINEILYHAPARATSDKPAEFNTTLLLGIDDETLWRYRADAEGLPVDWASRSHATGIDGWLEGPALIGYESSTLAKPIRTELPNPTQIDPQITTYYFERDFEFPADASPETDLTLRHLIDDGAVFYLNGHEFSRFSMPEGPIESSTLGRSVRNATFSEPVVLPMEYIRPGTNRLSIEVHQASPSSNDVVFGVELIQREMTSPFVPGQPYTESDEEWIELYNRSATRSIDLSGWRLDDAITYRFPSGSRIGPGEYRLIARDAEQLRDKYPEHSGIIVGQYAGSLSNQDENISLLDQWGNPADEVHYFDDGRWHGRADGGGSSLELMDVLADNSHPESWAASNEAEASSWQTVTYRGVVVDDGFTNGITTRYHEFIIGLLDAGEVLIDDVSVIEEPDGDAVQRIQNGTFESDTIDQSPQSWRIAGNHSSRVIADPDDPNNRVLKLTATGALEDRLNHGETTLVDNAPIRVGTTYEISFRAKWMSGSNQLNTHLYFDRLSRTTRLARSTHSGTPGAANSTLQGNLGPTYERLSHSPAVPEPNTPVTVSVLADDPQGIETIELWYAVDGGPYQDAEMFAGADGTYTGLIPAQSPGDVVQFFVQATDQLGASSYFPAGGPDSRALYVVQDGQAREGIHNLRIVMTPDDADWLHNRTNVMSNGRLGATVIYNEHEIFYDVGIRLKGSNAGRANDAYLGFNIAFDPTQRFRGVHESVAIDRSGRSSQTPQTQDEILIKHIGNQAGDIPYMYDDLVRVIAPRRTHTRTALLMMASYDDVFLDSQFDNGSDGTVFKLDIAYVPNGTTNGNPESPKIPFPYSHPQPTKDLRDLGDDKELYRSHLLIRNNRDRDDYRRIIEASQALSLSGDELVEAAQDVIDIDQWARTFALQSLVGAADVYTRGGLHHNIDFYVRPQDNRVLALPWDWDFAFTASTTQSLIGTSGTGGRLMNSVGVRRLYHGHLLDIINSTFNNSYMDRWIDHYGQVAGQNLRAIKSYISARRSFVLSRLPAQIPFQITTESGTTTEPTVVVSGRGWIDVRQIRIADTRQVLNVEWLNDQDWQASISLAEGINVVELEAIDHNGHVVGTDSVAITSLAANPVAQSLRITEINYNPVAVTDLEREANPTLDNDDFEFVELQNIGDRPIHLTNVQFSRGIQFTFADLTLAPGELTVVVKDHDAFQLRYGSDVSVAGEFSSGSLDNGGERLTLLDGSGTTILDFSYGDDLPWPESADGAGATLQLRSTDILVDQYGQYDAWYGSTQYLGSPGQADRPRHTVVINEVVSRNSPSLSPFDAIELHNLSDVAVDVGGWFLSDSADDLKKYEIPANTVVQPGGFLVVNENQFNPTPLDPGPRDFALSGTRGDDVWLITVDDEGQISTFVDDVHFGASAVGESFGRVPGTEMLAAMKPSLAAMNHTPRPGQLVISEIHFHPDSPSAAALAADPTIIADDLEFVEIHNPTRVAMDLSQWQLRGAVDFDFPDNMRLEGFSTLIVVPFNPRAVENGSRLAAFRAHYRLDPSVTVVGGYAGQLDDRSEWIQLLRPEQVTGDVIHVMEDDVLYTDSAPWPTAATGLSIHRVPTLAHGNRPGSWIAQPPTPGHVDLQADFDGDRLVNARDIDQLAAGIRAGEATFDLNGDRSATSADLRLLVDHILGTSSGDANLDGIFDSGDLVSIFRTGEYEDGITGNSGWAEGDWDGDGDFTTGDLVAAFQTGAYVSGVKPLGRTAVDEVLQKKP